MDAVEFAEIGSKIVKHGVELEKLRAERSKLDEQIKALEQELLPLLARHSELIATMMGKALPPIPAAPVAAPAVSALSASSVPLVNTLGEATVMPQVDKKILRRRIQKLVEDSGEALSAFEISERLKIDSTVVREVLLEMRGN